MSRRKTNAAFGYLQLGVIAYQMLSGKTPFSGEYQKVMEAHQETEPPPLEAKKVPKKVKKVVNFALAKTIDSRPPTAQSFASELRAQSEGIGALLRRSLTIYSEHLPKFLGLTILLLSPFIFVTILKFIFDIFYASGVIGNMAISTVNMILVLPTTFIGIFCGQLITGTTTWIVTQYLSIPLRPISLRTALRATRKKWKRLIGTGLISTGLTFLGLFACLIGFPILSVLFVLVAPVVMMEDLRGFAALKRSKQLTLRSLRTTIAAVFIMFLVPMIFGAIVSLLVTTSVKTIADAKEKMTAVQSETQNGAKSQDNPNAEKDSDLKISFGTGNDVEIYNSDEKKARKNDTKEIIRDGLTTILILPMQILLFPLSSIIVALLYLKTRQVGGESIQNLLAHFEETEQPRKNWQKRVHRRLEQSGRVTSKT
jgi:serine/threonine protein kinase